MGSFSGLGIGLSFLFGCTHLGLVAELYYLLWWKKRLSNREGIGDHCTTNQTLNLTPYLSCWKKPDPVDKTKTQEELLTSVGVSNSDVNGNEQDPELGMGKDLLLKGFGEESVECEIMRLHNLCGPPRFLFTITEETKEDLESERSRKGSRTRSLSDIISTLDNNTPFLTPLPSSPLDSYFNQYGFNPLFESSTEVDFNKLRSSPPPTFKFLRDAEGKLFRRLKQESEKRALKKEGPFQESVMKAPPNSRMGIEEKDGSFIRLVVGKSKEREVHLSTPSQVLPLASSPPSSNYTN